MVELREILYSQLSEKEKFLVDKIKSEISLALF